MIGRLLGIFLFPVIAYFTIYPMLTQEVNNAMLCNSNYTGNQTLFSYLQNNPNPLGKTDSFGGAGGAPHFGGYNGEVVHKSFVPPVYQTNSSFFNPDCEELTQDEKDILSKVPLIFMVGITLMGIFWYRHMFGYGGCFGWGDDI
jgi:hypothetical protein